MQIISMVYLFGIAGFIGGFIAGLMLLHFLLRHKTKQELLEDESLKWKYGLLNIFIAIMGAVAFVKMYQDYISAAP